MIQTLFSKDYWDYLSVADGRYFINPFKAAMLNDTHLALLYLKYVVECDFFIFDDYILLNDAFDKFIYVFNPNKVDLGNNELLTKTKFKIRDIPSITTQSYSGKMISQVKEHLGDLCILLSDNNIDNEMFLYDITIKSCANNYMSFNYAHHNLGRALACASIAAASYGREGYTFIYHVYDERSISIVASKRAMSVIEV